jgi:tetratricopeptide (TPR) repeat protein
MSLGDDLDPKREEAERLLRQANLQQMRGQHSEASESLKQALELNPEHAPSWELLGDMYRQAGDRDAAREAYKHAHELDAKLTSAERKYAEIVLQVAQEQQQREVWQYAVDNPQSDLLLPKRNPGLAFLLSMCLPGVGQLYNGDFVKGGIVIGIWFIGWVIIFASPEGNAFMGNFLRVLLSTSGARGGLSPLLTFALIVASLVHLYAMIDAPFIAVNRNKQLPGME